MKRLIACAFALVLPFAAFCQNSEAATPAESSAAAKSEWLQSFTAVAIEAAADVVLIQVPESEAPRIIYDTKGSYTTKFRFEVKNHVLHIDERVDARRPERTVITIYYNTLDALTVEEATVTLRQPIAAKLFDLTLGARASLTAALDVQDLNMELTGRSSRAKLTGKARYMTLAVANGTVDASELEVMAARVAVMAGGMASIDVTDRLEATTATNGTLRYKSEPAILREATRFMGGNIQQNKQQ